MHHSLHYCHLSCRYTVNGIHEPNLILKDNDLKHKIRMPYATAIEVFQQLQMDADFLHGIGVMDYSLLGAYELLTIARSV